MYMSGRREECDEAGPAAGQDGPPGVREGFRLGAESGQPLGGFSGRERGVLLKRMLWAWAMAQERTEWKGHRSLLESSGERGCWLGPSGTAETKRSGWIPGVLCVCRCSQQLVLTVRCGG